MKIGEKLFEQDGQIIHQRTFDPNPVLDRVADLKSAGIKGMKESYHVGSIPMDLVTQWAKEAGVQWGSEEHREIMRKKLLSGEFNKLRPWEGTF